MGKEKARANNKLTPPIEPLQIRVPKEIITSQRPLLHVHIKKKVQPMKYQWYKIETGKITKRIKYSTRKSAELEKRFREKLANKQIFCSEETRSCEIEEKKVEWKRELVVTSRVVNIPKTWNPVQSYTCEIIPVGTESKEYRSILSSMRDTAPDAIIEKLYRVQNLLIWEKYCTERKRMMITSNETSIEEKLLFHGTRNTNPRDIVCSQEGLDVRLSGNENLWGGGIYFAQDFSYVHPYSYPTSTGSRVVLVASVALGSCFDFGTITSPSLQKPPRNIWKSVDYDSITGVTNKSRVYAVYNSAKCCPRYIIKYSFHGAHV